jgi:hypothetical protein
MSTSTVPETASSTVSEQPVGVVAVMALEVAASASGPPHVRSLEAQKARHAGSGCAPPPPDEPPAAFPPVPDPPDPAEPPVPAALGDPPELDPPALDVPPLDAPLPDAPAVVWSPLPAVGAPPLPAMPPLPAVPESLPVVPLVSPDEQAASRATNRGLQTQGVQRLLSRFSVCIVSPASCLCGASAGVMTSRLRSSNWAQAIGVPQRRGRRQCVRDARARHW